MWGVTLCPEVAMWGVSFVHMRQDDAFACRAIGEALGCRTMACEIDFRLDGDANASGNLLRDMPMDKGWAHLCV